MCTVSELSYRSVLLKIGVRKVKNYNDPFLLFAEVFVGLLFF